MDYRDIKQRLWEKIVYIARKYTGFRVMVIVWLAVYYWNRLVVRAVCRKPKAAAAVITSFCLVLTISGSAWADSLTHGQIMSEQVSDSEGLENAEDSSETPEEDIPAYRLDVDALAPEGVITEGYEISPEFAVTLTNTGIEDLTGLAVFLESQEACRLYYESEGKRFEVVPSEFKEDIELPGSGEGNTEDKEGSEAPGEGAAGDKESSEAPGEGTAGDKESSEAPGGENTEDKEGSETLEGETAESEESSEALGEGTTEDEESSEAPGGENTEDKESSETPGRETAEDEESSEASAGESTERKDDTEVLENVEEGSDNKENAQISETDGREESGNEGSSETAEEPEKGNTENAEGSEASEEPSGDLLTDTIEKKELPAVLPAGSSLVIYVALPLGGKAGAVEDICHVQVNEIEEEYCFPVLFMIEAAAEDNSPLDTELGSEDLEDVTNPDSADIPASEAGVESGSSENSEVSDSVSENEPDTENTEDITNLDALGNSALPGGTDAEDITDVGIDNNPEADGDTAPDEIASIECTMGFRQGKVFFARGDSQYIVHMSPQSAVSELCYRVDSLNGKVPVVEGAAVIGIPENVNDMMEIYYVDIDRQKVVLHQEYVVNEKNMPLISYEIIDGDGQKYVQIIVEDSGSIVSGLSNVRLSCDGEAVTEIMPQPLRTAVLCDGSSVLAAQLYEFPLEGEEEHSFEVSAEDNNGNATVKNFTLSGARDDIIRVVLPTSFSISLVPDSKDNQLYGENIILQNRSSFPVSVNVASAEVLVDHTIPENVTLSQTLLASGSAEAANIRELAETNKKCDLEMNLMLAESSEVQSYALEEGVTNNIVSFVLAPGNADSPAVEMQRYDMEQPVSPDYAVMNLRGIIDQSTRNCWESGDLKVKIVFSFQKDEQHQEPEQETEAGSDAVGVSGIDGISDVNTKETELEPNL